MQVIENLEKWNANFKSGWHKKSIINVLPPRVTITRLKRGGTIGNPNDNDQQQRILEKTLDLLRQNAPIESVFIEEI